jgi:aspartate 1-decarboxylase
LYGSAWRRDYFNHDNGGYLVVDKQRIEHSKISKNEKEKFDKEYAMSIVLALNGHRIEMLKERSGFSSSDITINGIMAELKKTSSHNNMLNYAKKAIDKQGAKIVIFEFKNDTKKIQEELNKMKRMEIKIYYYFTDNKDKIHIL